MRQSLRLRLIILFATTIVSSVFLIWCMNFFLLNSYYEKSKIEQMKGVHQVVEELCKEIKWGTLTEAESENLISSLDGLSANNGVNIYVASVYYNITDLKYPRFFLNWQVKESVNQLYSYVEAEEKGIILKGNHQFLYEKDHYKVYKVYDQRVGSNYIELISKVNDVTWVYLRMNYQNIKESANISNRLLTYVGTVVTLLGIFVMIFVSQSYTKPIMRLVDHAKKMTELDFNVRYDENRVDEIGILGKSMNQLSGKLESTISELKTANNELQIDIERKEKQEEMRTEFLANVSHELKTPIALIQGYAEGLQDNISDDLESREFYCEVIIDEANKMNRMVKRLLDLNQLEFGNDQVHMERFDIVQMIQSIVLSNELFAKQRNVTLSFSCKNRIDENDALKECEEAPVYVWADEYMIDEVITNYVSNAFNHVAPSKDSGYDEMVIEIKIEMGSLVAGNKVKISVFNTGDPILEEDIYRIWDKFYKVDKARTREYGGNGIGLSIVKAVMESHNQHYGVENYGNGVEFWFELDGVNTHFL